MRISPPIKIIAPSFVMACCQFLSAPPVVAQEVQYRGGRETAGYIEQRGWESGLVRANPNLSHFMWSPVTTMIQAPVAIRVGTEMKMTRPDNTQQAMPKLGSDPPIYRHTPYVKPDHIATLPNADVNGSLLNRPSNDLSGQMLPRHYDRPIKADLNGRLLPRHYVKPEKLDVAGSLISRNVKAQLVDQTSRKAPVIASYGEGPHFLANNISRARADVNGTIVSRGHLLHSN